MVQWRLWLGTHVVIDKKKIIKKLNIGLSALKKSNGFSSFCFYCMIREVACSCEGVFVTPETTFALFLLYSKSYG